MPLPALTLVRRPAGLVLAAWLAAPALAQEAPVSCVEVVECRRMALDAEAVGDFERFHDLAQRAARVGRAGDPSLMYLLARAQVSSGRPADALATVRRLTEMGVATDVARSPDFEGVRALPEWPAVHALMARVPVPVIVSTGSTGSTGPASVGPSPAGPAPAAPKSTASASNLAVSAAPAPAARSEREAAARRVGQTGTARPFPLRPGRTDESARFTADRFSSGGLAYDAVSHRFVVGDALGRKLMVIGMGTGRPTDMVREESAGFSDVTAVEIDERRGDLWVASADPDRPGSAVHRLQLVSGRPLRTYRGAAAASAVLIDLAVAASGTIVGLDGSGTGLLTLQPGANEMTVAMPLTLSGPVSITTAEADGVVYVAHGEGIARVDLRAKTSSPVSSSRGFDLTQFARVRRHRNTLVGGKLLPDGGLQIVRLELSGNGRAIVDAAVIEPTVASVLPSAPASLGSRPFFTISGDSLYYLVDAGHAGDATSSTSLAIRRLELR